MIHPYMLTFTGRKVNPLTMTPEDVCKEDVAHHLALTNRFGGATRRPITVAQHAVYVSRLLDGTGLEWQGLHHDDGEAFWGDLVKPLKESPEMIEFRVGEAHAQVMCYKAFKCDPADYYLYPHMMHPLVEQADRLMVRFEAEQGFAKGVWNALVKDNPKYPPITPEECGRIGAWKPWSWKQSEEAFLVRFRELSGD